MKKIFKGLMCAGLAGALAFGFVGAAGCKKDSGGRNPETDPLRLAIGPVDEKFNPLYFTSQNDGTIASLTQVSLITTDANGDFAVGDNYPTVALDYTETYYDQDGIKIATGDGNNVNYVGENNQVDVDGSTTYEFLIKKGMKFSDGIDLTVVDVLFNLYVYLDPLYNGSNTIYSTKIKGLQAYRQNDANADEDSEGSTTSEFRLLAEARMNRLIEWSDPNYTSVEEIPDNDPDLLKVKELYTDELNSDWNSTVASWVENYKDYYFTEAWQAFYFAEGAVTEQTKKNSNGVDVRFKDNNGKYPTTLDPQVISYNEETGEIELGEVSQAGQLLINAMEGAASETRIDEYLAKPENSGINRENAKLTLQKEHAINYLINANIRRGALHNVLRFNVTASTAYEYFLQDEMSKAMTEQKVDNISGITVSHTADSKYNNQFNGKTYTEDHDILKIEINGVDPKAKWNFGFTVAPMHYYSGTYGGVNYVQLAKTDYENRNNQPSPFYDGAAKNFGVKYSDINFTTDVLAAAGKNGVPMGAGPYKCTTYDYGKSSLNSRTFFRNYMAYFERNAYFTTMGANVENAKIKYVTYRVTSDDKIVNALKTGEIDYGEPTAKATNQADLQGFRQITYQTGGYGYVGINPKYVPNITIRRAIMKAFNKGVMYNYYGEGLVNIIERPMTATSWVWKEEYGCDDKLTEPYYTEAESAQDIIDFIIADGAKRGETWTFDGSNWRLNGVIQSLKYNFTIAGESNDHPAYNMFVLAEQLLEEAGFDIEVGNDPKALQKLVTGDLQVWAAAWSSSIDPDPYQVYSIYSNASSTKNWYKDGILDNRDRFPTEYSLAMDIRDKITEGRQSIVRYDRAQTYAGDDGCLDLIMELAVEFPTYQRYDLCVFDDSVLDRNTMTASPSHNMGLIDELWKLNYVQ